MIIVVMAVIDILCYIFIAIGNYIIKLRSEQLLPFGLMTRKWLVAQDAANLQH